VNQLIDGEGREIPVLCQEDWQEKRARVLVAMREVMGVLPGEEKRCAVFD
jgi:hypothetical protein